MQISDKVKNAVTSRIAEAKKRVVQSTAPKTVKNSPQASKPSLDIVSIVKSGMSKTSPNFTTRSNSWQYKPDGTRKTFDELTNAEVLTWISTLDKSEQQGAALDFETNYLKNPGSTRYDPYYTSYSNNDEARALFGVNTFDQKWIDANRQAYMPYVHFSGEKYTSPKAPGKYASDLEKTAYQYWLIANTYEQTTQAAENEYAKLRAEIAEKAKIYRASGEGVTAQELLDGIDWSEYETLENLREASRAGNGRYLNRPVQVGDSSLTAMINAALRGEDVSGAKDYLWEESRYILSGGSRKAQTQAAAEAEQTDERAYNTSNNYDPYYADISNNAEARALFGVETFDQAWIDANRGKYMQYIDFGGEDKKTPVKPGKDASQIEKDAYQYWLIANTYEETTREGEKELEKLREWMKKKADRYTAEEIVGQIDWEDYPTLQNMREVAEAGNARMINRPVKAGDESILQMARELTGEIGENADESDVSAPDPEAMVNVADSDVAKAPANGSGYWDWWQQFGQVMGDIVSVSREQQKKAVDISDGIQYNKFVGSLRSSMSLDASIAFMRSQASALNFVASEEDRAMYRQQLELLEMERDERQRIEERVRAEVDAAVGGNGGRNLGERIIDDLMQNLIISGADQVPIQDYEAYLRNHMGLETGQNPEMDKYDAPTAGEERAGLIALGAAEGFDKAATATTQGAEYVLYEIKRRLPWNQGKTKEELYYTDRDLNALYGWNQQFSRKWVEDSERERLAAEYPVFNQVSMGVSELIKMIGQATGASIVPGMPGWYGLDLLKNGGKVARTIEGTLGKAANSMPFYLDIYAQTYETAQEEGATEDQAGMAAAINAMASGWLSSKAVEGLGKLGGSVTRLFTSRIGKRAAQKGLTNVFKSGWGEALLAIGKAAISEGSEEAIEEPIMSGIAKLVYDRDRAWYGEGAVIDPQAMLESGVGGAIAGPMFTVASGLSGALGQTARQKSEEILERTGRGEIVPLDEIEELGRIEAREAEIQDATETLAAQRQPEIDAAGEKAQAAMDAATAAQERAEAAQAELNTRVEEAQPVMQAINEGTASYEDPEVQKEVSTRSDAIKQARDGLTLANTELAQEQTRAAEAAQEAQETIDRIREEARTEATAQVDANIEAERQAEAQAAADQKEAVRQEVMKQIAGKETPGVKELHTQNLSADQLGQMRILDALGRQYKVEIDVVDTLGGANGMYAGGRHVVVALDALEGAYVQTAAHEMVHYIKQTSPEAYSLLETEVAQYLIDNDLFDFNEAVRQRMEEYRAQGIDADEEYAIEEIIAETVPAIFSDENVIRDFVDKNRTLAQKIRDFFVEFAEKLRKIALNYAAENERYEISAVLAKAEESADVLYGIAEAFDAAMEMAGEAETQQETRFSLNKPVEETKTLIAVHNLTEDKLKKSMDLGGLPMPSIAIAKAELGHQNFGDISLVFGRDTIDPKSNTKNKVYSADAWTPTFPRIEYEADERQSRKVYSDMNELARKVPEDYRDDIKRVINDIDYQLNRYEGEIGLIENLMDNYGFKAAYLASQGEPVDMVKTTKTEGRVSGPQAERYEKILAIFDGDAYVMLNTPLRQLVEQHRSELEKVLPDRILNDSTILARIIRGAAEYSTGSMQPKQVEVSDVAATNRQIDERIDADAYRQWATDLFSGIEGQKGVANGKDPYTPSGSRRSFAQTHYPVSVENIAKAMLDSAGGNVKNISGFHGVKSLRASTAEKFSSVAAMHKREGRIQARTQEEADALTSMLDEQLNDLILRILKTKSTNRNENEFIAIDTVGTIIMEDIADGKYSEESIRKVLNGYGYQVDDAIVKDLKGLLDEVANMPVNIFEAKPERAVYFDEVKAAIVPDNMNIGIRGQLESVVENVIEYPAGDETARLEALNGLEGVRFSLNNAQLATGEIRGDETREMLGKAAGKTLREYKSSADRAETAARLSAMSEAYAAGKDAEAEAIADQLARKIIEKSSDVDMSVPRQYAETRKRLREEGVSLTDTQKQETANQYGSYNDFRKSLMGSVKIKNEAKSLDAIWGELSDMHPEMFPAETGEGEMPGKLMEFVQAMKPKYVNPYGMDMEGAAADLSLRLQSDVLGMINKPDRAKAALADANALRERYSRENSEKRRQAREERQKKFREAADKLFAAREAGDAEAEQAAVDEYRKLRAGTSGRAMLADAAEAGIQIRKAGREIGRLDRLIAQMNETIKGKDLDNEASIERLIEERNTYIEMRDQLKRQQNALHRQEMIARAGMDAAQDADEWEADVAMNDAINVDTAEHIDSLRSSIHDKVNQLAARMKAKMADYNMTSTIDVNDVEFFFEDVLGEMQMQSGMVKVWEERLAAAERQLDMEKKIQQQLQKRVDLHEGGDGVDVNALRVQISEAKDRIDALESARRTADREATYARRVGAESLQKALREGRLPQPIMERVIAIFSEAGRRGKFNSTLLMQNMEATRLNYTTAARVWDDLFGDLAPIIRGIYYDPVMDNETDRQKWINEWRGRISELKLTKQESEAVQRVGEGKLTLDEAVEFGSVEKIQQAVELFRQFYDEAWDMADRAMVRNGYESPGKRARYFPHIDEAKNFWQKLGLPIESSTLPTSINGLTETFSPGKQYSGHLQHREGDTTDYDALAGFEEYIASVSNVIYHTDDIQRMRQLETEIRAAANNGLFKSLKNGSGKEHLSEFVKWVHEYTNLLAGKKSSSDRGIESPHGRAIYRTLNKLRSMKGRSAVMGNAASAITNFVPVQQVIGEHPVAAVKAAAQLHMGNVIGQGNVPESQYLIRRFGSDSVVKTAYTRFSKAAGWGFEAVDHLASKLVVATYYQANLDMGMDSETAMRSADAKAARLMGDRSKGAMPNVYGSQFIGFLTQFQYEVANQSQHFRKDIWREKGLGKGLVTVFMTALTGWLFNEVQERITGRRSAMDPIDMTMDAWKVWQDTGELLPVAQSIYNNVSDIFPYIGMLGDGGRITAFEGISDLMSAMLAGDGDLGYSLKQFAWDIVPMGGQIKKSWRGALALARGGYYNSKGDKLYFPVEASNPFEAAQALIFGPTSIRAAVDYYAGDADALTASETKAYQQDMARGMTATEAYQNEVKQAQAEDLMAEAKETEETPIDAEKQQAAGIQMTPEGQQKLEKAQADADTVDAKRDEARALREQTVPSELMSDRYWALKDSDQLKAAIRLWQISGDDWAMPYTYDEMRKFTIDGEAEYLGPELADFANKYYEDEYMTLMAGVDPERMDEEELADLKVDIEKIKTSLDKELRKMIEDERR